MVPRGVSRRPAPSYSPWESRDWRPGEEKAQQLGISLLNFFPQDRLLKAAPPGGSRISESCTLVWPWHVWEQFFGFFFKSERMSNLQIKVSSHTGKTPGKILVSHLFLVSQGSSFGNGSSVSAGLWPKFVKLVFFGCLNWIIRVVFSFLVGKW